MARILLRMLVSVSWNATPTSSLVGRKDGGVSGELELVSASRNAGLTEPRLLSSSLADSWGTGRDSLYICCLMPKYHKAEKNKKLSQCWDSTTCKPLHAGIIAIKVLNSIFPILHWSSSVQFEISRYDLVSLGMQVTTTIIQPCANFHFLLHSVIKIHEHYRQTDRRMSCS